MFKFNFNINENDNNEYLNTTEDNINLLDQESGYFRIDDLQSIVQYSKTKENVKFL